MYIDGLCIYAITKEFNEKLSGSRIDKIFQPNKYTFIFHLRTTSQLNAYLYISSMPQQPCIAIIDNLPDNPSEPSAFCMLLRKHLIDGRIDNITQHSLDRVIIFNINTRAVSNVIETKQIIIELTGKNSNIIFVNNGLIVESLRRISKTQNRYRQIFPNIPYQAPPSYEQINILSADNNLFADAISHNTHPVQRAISNLAIGIGSITAKEICFRAQLTDTKECQLLDTNDLASLNNTVQEFRQELLHDRNGFTLTTTGLYGKPFALTPFIPHHLQGNNDYSFHSFSDANSAIIFSLTPGNHKYAGLQEKLLSISKEELKKQQKKMCLLQSDLQKARTGEQYKLYGDILMANLHNIKQGMQTVILQNFYQTDDENCNIEISLSPIHKPSDNAQRYYTKYNKAKRALLYINNELGTCASEINYLENIIYYIENAEDTTELQEIEAEIKKNLSSKTSSPDKKSKQKNNKKTSKKKSGKPAIEIIQKNSPNGLTVSIGRNNKQNDFVTFKRSSPVDIWLHAKDIPGSHVILHTNGKQYHEEDLIFAAQCAAYHSKYRNSSNVPIDYTERKNVTKPNGSKPGFVIYEKQKTLFVEPLSHL